MFNFSLLELIVYTFLILSLGAGIGILTMCILIGSKE